MIPRRPPGADGTRSKLRNSHRGGSQTTQRGDFAGAVAKCDAVEFSLEMGEKTDEIENSGSLEEFKAKMRVVLEYDDKGS